ncbi:MAG: hypothetical protein ACK5IJ_01900 [Mangrovibacterium sp.]
MDNITVFFEMHNLKLVSQDSSINFGDSFKIFANDKIAFRVVCERSSTSIDICSFEERNNWFDLALLRALLNDDKKLNKPMRYEDYICFLKDNIETIETMFDHNNYSNTRLKLQELEVERIRQLFTGIK